ncbi:MAG: nickel pincer cofactor biosynthesis protein LarC [Clostridiaceae bacterium]|nr:nickel pincer cofactor biosynthesis protein LarC [Clostridiaceae bacterium]
MKILYYDCFAGISGDMNLGAMLDLGVDSKYLINELSKLSLNNEFNIKIKTDIRKGISGTKVDVILLNQEPSEEEHSHEQVHHQHNHVHHTHEEEKQDHHHQRNLQDIEDIINSAGFSEKVKTLSLKIFYKIALAEAKIHNKPIDQVHFHEVGATDSIVDIIGAAICADYLKVDKILCGQIQLGGGFVKCEHGLFPVPAPATMEILKGIKVKSGIVPFEMTTPTGAAILAAMVDEFSDLLEFTATKIGYGIGGRDTEIPNVLRVYLGETKEEYLYEEAVIIECNIDDMNPEVYDYVLEKLFSAGAQDVYLTPIIMKKGRPAITLSVLGNPMDEIKLENLVLSETSTLGIRKYRVKKKMLKREIIKLQTSYGEINVKAAYLNGEKVKFKPEYDECKKIALEKNVPIFKIYEEINKKL